MNTVQKSSAMLASVRDHQDFTVYDEPVRKSSVIRTISKPSLMHQHSTYSNANLRRDNSERFSHVLIQGPVRYEEEFSPLNTHHSNIKKHQVVSSMNFIDDDNMVVYHKRGVQTYQDLPGDYELTQRKEVRRQYKYV